MTQWINAEQTGIWLQNHDNYLILTHRRPDGDAHGSAVGLALLLKKFGKTAFILRNPETTKHYIPFVEAYWAEDNYVPDTIVTVDIASESMFAYNAEPFLGHVDLSIDHHPSNSAYAAFTCLNGERASCGEVIFDIMKAMKIQPDIPIAEMLYIALSTDTGCFAFANTTANTFHAAGAMADTGLNFRELNRLLFRTKTRRRFLLEGYVMSGVEFYYGGKVSVITITRDIMDKTGCTENDMDDIAAIPGSIEGVLCGITLRELSSVNDCKVSVRTSPEVDANSLCRALGGGGHAMASGASPKGMTVYQMKEILLKELETVFPGENI